MRRRLRPTRFGGRIALTTVGICLGTVAVVYIYVVWIAGAGAGDGAVKREIVVGGPEREQSVSGELHDIAALIADNADQPAKTGIEHPR